MTFDSLSCSMPASAQLNFDKNKLLTLIADYVGIEPKRVTDQAHFTDDLGLDWLDQVELMILIEDEFHGVQFSEGDVKQMEIIGDLIRHIERQFYTEHNKKAA